MFFMFKLFRQMGIFFSDQCKWSKQWRKVSDKQNRTNLGGFIYMFWETLPWVEFLIQFVNWLKQHARYNKETNENPFYEGIHYLFTFFSSKRMMSLIVEEKQVLLIYLTKIFTNECNTRFFHEINMFVTVLCLK